VEVLAPLPRIICRSGSDERSLFFSVPSSLIVRVMLCGAGAGMVGRVANGEACEHKKLLRGNWY
jgi:hypothetical protein